MGLIVSISVTFLLLPSLISLFASEKDINVKDTEKSLITAALGEVLQKSKVLIFGTTIFILL